jgi:hypothetical protein
VDFCHTTLVNQAPSIRAGNQKEALGLEHLEAPTDLSFLEPSYLFDLLFGPFNSGFNPGVAILNSTTDKRMTWELGVWGNNSDPFGYSIGNDWAHSGRYLGRKCGTAVFASGGTNRAGHACCGGWGRLASGCAV